MTGRATAGEGDGDGCHHHHRRAAHVPAPIDRTGLRLVLPGHVPHLDPGVLHRLRGDARQPRSDQGTGADPTTGIATGAALETLLIVANVATAVVAYPVLKRESEMGAIGYVSARLVEAMFIAIGIVGALAFLLMRQDATAVSAPALGDAFDSLYYRAFLLGPGFFAGLANGVILGYLMYRSELVPRGMTWLGLIGGPLVMIAGILVMFDAIERESSVQVVATIPEFFWELSLSLYCIVRGFRPPPVLDDVATVGARP